MQTHTEFIAAMPLTPVASANEPDVPRRDPLNAPPDTHSASVIDTLEAIVGVLAAESVGEASRTLADDLQRRCAADRVVIGLTGRRRDCRIVAISHTTTFDTRSETAQRFKAAQDEAIVRNKPTSWPPESAAGRPATLAHRRLVNGAGLGSAVSVPLTTRDGQTVGVCTLVAPRRPLPETAAEPLAEALRSIGRSRGPLQRCVRRWKARPRVWWTLIAVTAMLAIGLLSVPLPHRVTGVCHVQPMERRFAVAPFDGLLERCHVRPGEVVRHGQLLATMDGRELRLQLSGLLAEHQRVTRQRDLKLAARNVPEAQLADLEAERLAAKIQLARWQLDHLQVRSAMDGVVVQGERQDLAGAPMRQGDLLFEVASLDPMRLEVAVSQDELNGVDPNAAVTASVEGAESMLTGAVARIRPRAEVRDQQNVFIVEVPVANRHDQLRPGMTGRAKIRGQRRTLAWSLLRRVWP